MWHITIAVELEIKNSPRISRTRWHARVRVISFNIATSLQKMDENADSQTANFSIPHCECTTVLELMRVFLAEATRRRQMKAIRKNGEIMWKFVRTTM